MTSHRPGKIPWNKGLKMSDDFKKKCRDRQIGVKRSDETKLKMSIKRKGVKKNFSIDARNKIGEVHRGENSHWWEGGKTKERQRIHNTIEYRDWRKAVFERDDYTCVLCKKKGGKLNADHIKPFALHPELRLDINNGRTLCVPCHRKTDTYGRGTVYRKQLVIHSIK